MKVGDVLVEFKLKPPSGAEAPVLTLTERNGFVLQSERFNKRLATDDTSGYKYINRDDFAFNPYLLWAGAIARNDRFEEGVISPLYPTFRAREGYSPSFLSRIMLSSSMIKGYDSIAFGSVPRRRRSSVKDFLDLEIPELPSFEDQQRIADILDKADALRAKRREAIAHLDSLGQSIFHEMFGNPMRNEHGWELKPLRTLLAGIDSGKSPVCASNPALHGGSGVLKLSAVTSGHWVPQENKAVEGSLPDLRNEVALGDVLFTRKNTPQLVAAVAQVDSETGVRLFLPDLIFRLNIRDEDVVMREFLVGVLQNEAQRSFVQSLATGSSQSMVNISKPKLMSVRVPVPPIELQRQFSRMVSGIRLAKEKNLRQLDELDNLFLSLQDRAFKGEV